MGEGVLGAVIAGGRSTRYGSPKALAAVAGARIIDRVVAALRDVTADEPVLITNDAELAAAVGLPWRADAVPGIGALGGIHSALLWAAERACRGALAVACDMPFLSSKLLGALVERGSREPGADVVIPESGGRRGVEPLCAFYSTACLEAVERSITAGDHRVIAFHNDVRVERMAIAEVATFGAPDELFLNVNTPEDRVAAERIAARRMSDASRA